MQNGIAGHSELAANMVQACGGGRECVAGSCSCSAARTHVLRPGGG